MKKILKYILPAVVAGSLVTGAYAGELEGVSAYKVTTYSLGTSFDFQSDVSLRNFEPLLITSSKADILNSQLLDDSSLQTSVDLYAFTGFAISAEYHHDSRLALQGTFGVAQNAWNSEPGLRGSGWEASLGVVYKLLGNLNYELHFGYMDPGNLFKERNSYSDVENIIMVSNKISMSF